MIDKISDSRIVVIMKDKETTREEPSTKHSKHSMILMTEFVTHDVKRFVVEKPEGYEFLPGQANLVSIPKDRWKEEYRPFTFTSSNSDLILEFIIKGYPEHDGMTQELHNLKSGERITLHEPFGTIRYQGHGVFLSAGAGITPFIAIFRALHSTNQLDGNILFFSNKSQKDIILEKELREMFGENLVLTLSREEKSGYEHGRITKDLIQERVDHADRYFYLCGPDPFVLDLRKVLLDMGVEEDKIVAERIVVSDA